MPLKSAALLYAARVQFKICRFVRVMGKDQAVLIKQDTAIKRVAIL